MTRLLLILLFGLLATGCTDTRAEQYRKAVEREIDQRVEARTKEYAERRLASFRMIVLGSIALVSVVALCTIEGSPPAPRPQPPIRTVTPVPEPESSSRRRPRRIIDLGP